MAARWAHNPEVVGSIPAEAIVGNSRNKQHYYYYLYGGKLPGIFPAAIQKPMLINQSETKKFIRNKIERLRPGWAVTQISQEAIDIIEARLRNMIIRMIESHPTRGKTFMGE